MTEEYDFVMIGGGTAGLVVATRLSEDPNVSVLVVEAGLDHRDDPRVKTPALHNSLKKTEADWDFRTEPQAELNDRTIHVAQGRALGGSSVINATMFVPPSRAIIDSWEALGNPGWNWETMMPYYAKSYSLKVPEGGIANHLGINWAAEGPVKTGPLQVSYPGQLQDPLPKAWMETFKSLGYEMKRDPFSGAPTGAFSSLATVDPVMKERSNSVTAYYAPVADRKNLHVLTGCLVKKILFTKEKDEQVATGVQFQQDGETKVISVRKEIILAAGSLQSPKILELSGIGNAKLLNSHGIEVLIDNLNVGENLQDHLFCSMSFEARDNMPTLDDLVRRDPKAIETAMSEYNISRTGLFTSVGVTSYAYLPAMDFIPTEGQAKLKILLDSYLDNEDKPAAKGNFEIARKILEDVSESSGAFLTIAAQSDVMDSPFGPQPGKFVTINAMLCQPLSTGSVHIGSSSPKQIPVLDPNYLSNPIDLEILARHIQYLPTIASTEPFRSTILKEGGRRKGDGAWFTDLEGAKKFVRRRGVSMWHPTSTCAMLPREKGGVVDERLRVYGTRGLRIVDASIIPIIPRANIQSSVYAVAERAADIIKADHGLKMEE